MARETKRELLEKGVALLLKHGYADLGLAALLEEAGVPKGSFYHHFETKEDFALQVVDLYMEHVHAALDHCLHDEAVPPLARVERFFSLVSDSYRGEGYLGCLLGGLGQELSGVSETFRKKVEQCFNAIGKRLGACLDEAARRGELKPGTDTRALSELLVNCWEGAALRSRMRRSAAPLRQMLDFYLNAVRA